MLDHIIRNARVPGHGELVDIGFAQGKIAALEHGIISDAPAYDAAGCLCCGGLVETRIHLDKSRIVDRCAPPPERSVDNAIERVSSIKHTFTVDDVYERARTTVERSIAACSKEDGIAGVVRRGLSYNLPLALKTVDRGQR